MKKSLLILSIFITLNLSAQVRYSTTKTLMNFRTSDVVGKKPITADFTGYTICCLGADSSLWQTVNGVITRTYIMYPYTASKPVMTERSVTSTGRYGNPKFQYYVKKSTIPGNLPIRADFTSPNMRCWNTTDSVMYELVKGVITPTWVIYPYSTTPNCTYIYSAWSECQPNGTQTRTLLSSSPSGCAGTPVLVQNCTYNPPVVLYGERNFYVSETDGDDSRTSTQAHYSNTPWKTIAKVNSYCANFLPGDSILFKAGDTLQGTLLLCTSGSSTKPIVLTSYGTGKAVISGFEEVSGWVNKGSGVWESAVTNCTSILNMVTVNDIPTPVGRYPNTGYLAFEAATANTSITDNQLTNTPNWTGAEVVIRCNAWSIAKGPISNHTNTVITYSGASQNANVNFGYFIQKDVKTLDTLNEWYYNPSTKTIKMYFGASNPNSYKVKASVCDYVYYTNARSYITIDNLVFEGSNKATIYIASGNRNKIQNCDIKYSGMYGIHNYSTSPYLLIENNTVTHSYHKGIQTLSDYATIRGNTVKYSGLVPGMGNEIGGYSGIEIQGDDYNLVEYNTVDSSGNNGIFLRGNGSIAKNNFINNFGLTVNDCGGIYTAGANKTGRKILGNIILNGIGNTQGTSSTSKATQGIYLDEPITGVYVEGNTIAHCGLAGLRYHNAYSITARFNTMYDNPSNILIIKSNSTAAYSRNLIINNNICVSKTETQLAFNIYNYISDNPLLYGTSDSNYYYRPISEGQTIKTRNVNTINSYTLSEWQAASGQDLNSHVSPISATEYFFDYNATQTNKTVTLSGTWTKLDGTTVSGNITILPYKSIILIR